MKKESYYFQHDYNAKSDQKILMLRGEYGLEGYALFFMVLEDMAQDTDGYLNRGAIGGLSIGYGLPKEKVTEMIDFCINIGLFFENKKGIYSKRMLEHKNIRKSYSEAGKRGAKQRWKNRGAIRGANNTPNAKERKGKEKKENNISSKEDNSEADNNNQLKEYKKKEITKQIDYVVNRIKEKCDEMQIAYDKTRDRQFAKHILTAKEYGKFCENVGMSREDFACGVVEASVKIGYWKGARSGPKTIYQDYANVYNEAKQKTTEKKNKIGVLPGLDD